MPQAQTVRESEKGSLNFAADGTVTSDYIKLDQRKAMAHFLINIPSGFAGVLFPVMSDEPDGVYSVAYDSDGNLAYADPTSKIADSWYSMKSECLFPAHYIKFASKTSTAGTAGTAQSAARVIKFMGIS